MGACASVPKTFRSLVAAPEPVKEDTTSTAVEEPKFATTVEVDAKDEEVVEKKADDKEEKALEVEKPKEVAEAESEKQEQVVEAQVSSEPEATSNDNEEKKKNEVVKEN